MAATHTDCERLGQYDYTGHVINLPQMYFICPQSSDAAIQARCCGCEETAGSISSWRAIVQDALKWLLENKYYWANTLTKMCFGSYQRMVREWWDEWADITSVEELPSEDLSQPSEEYIHSSHLPSSFVPNPALQQTEQETVHQCIQARQSTSTRTLMWPTIGGVPINEFTTEGYFSMAFPTLFLTGAAVFLLHAAMKSLLETTSNICWCMKTVDLLNTFHGGCCFLAPHCNEVTIGNDFKYMLMYEDSRFTKHFFPTSGSSPSHEHEVTTILKYKDHGIFVIFQEVAGASS